MDKLKTAQIMREALATDVGFNSWTVSTPHLQIAFEIVARLEREACARIADEWSGHYQANEIANEIRKRSDDKTTND